MTASPWDFLDRYAAELANGGWADLSRECYAARDAVNEPEAIVRLEAQNALRGVAEEMRAMTHFPRFGHLTAWADRIDAAVAKLGGAE